MNEPRSDDRGFFVPICVGCIVIIGAWGRIKTDRIQKGVLLKPNYRHHLMIHFASAGLVLFVRLRTDGLHPSLIYSAPSGFFNQFPPSNYHTITPSQHHNITLSYHQTRRCARTTRWGNLAINLDLSFHLILSKLQNFQSSNFQITKSSNPQIFKF